jgi:hypothetical protein
MALVTGAQDVILYQLGDSIQRQLFSGFIERKLRQLFFCL